ncbi:MAG: hypothetical protein AABY32_00710 [Nanoarchaeota archaeon]
MKQLLSIDGFADFDYGIIDYGIIRKEKPLINSLENVDYRVHPFHDVVNIDTGVRKIYENVEYKDEDEYEDDEL